MKYKTQKTKYSCGAVAIYNAFLYLGVKSDVEKLRDELQEKHLYGVDKEDTLRVLRSRNLRINIKKDKNLKYYSPHKATILRFRTKNGGHLSTLVKITKHYVYITNNYSWRSPIKKCKPIYRMSKESFKEKIDYYITVQP